MKNKKILVGSIFVFLFLGLGFLKTNSSKQNTKNNTNIILPVRFEDVSFAMGGIWPYGVQGGDHPHGHPGIDFRGKENTEILAVDDGTITVVQTNIGQYQEDSISLIPDSLSGKYEIYYTGSMKNFVVNVGDTVKQGDVIAHFRPWTEGGRVFEDGSIHFEIHKRSKGKGGSLCPYIFMTEEAKTQLKNLHNKSTYDEMDDYPLLCNPCPTGGCY